MIPILKAPETKQAIYITIYESSYSKVNSGSPWGCCFSGSGGFVQKKVNIIDKIDRLTVKAKEKVGWTRNFGLVICDTLEDVEEKTAEFNDRYGEGIWNAVFVYGADDLQEESENRPPVRRAAPVEKKKAEADSISEISEPLSAPQSEEKQADIKLFTDYRNALESAKRFRRLARLGDASRYEDEACELERLIYKTGQMEVYKQWASTH